jgi:hypothetical protein
MTSPTTATFAPPACSCRTAATLSSGSSPPRTSVIPTWMASRSAVAFMSPVSSSGVAPVNRPAAATAEGASGRSWSVMASTAAARCRANVETQIARVPGAPDLSRSTPRTSAPPDAPRLHCPIDQTRSRASGRRSIPAPITSAGLRARRRRAAKLAAAANPIPAQSQHPGFYAGFSQPTEFNR